MKIWKKFIQNEDGMGVIEVVLIIVILVGLALIFKSQITTIITNIFATLTNLVNQF